MTARREIAVLSERALCRQGTAALLDRPGWHVLQCTSVAQVAAAARSRSIDAVVVDIDHASSDLYAFARSVRAAVPGKMIVIGSPVRYAAIDLDVPGVLDGDAKELVAAVTTSRKRRPRGTPWSHLTPRQRDVLRWLAIGLDNKAIGHELGIGERAVKAHVTALLSMFELTNRTQLALLAQKGGYRASLSYMSRRRRC